MVPPSFASAVTFFQKECKYGFNREIKRGEGGGGSEEEDKLSINRERSIHVITLIIGITCN